LILNAGCFGQSTASNHYRLKFENDVAVAYEVTLPAGEAAPVFQSAHDTFWLSLSDSTVTFKTSESTKMDARFLPGDARYFPSFGITLIRNIGTEEFKAVMISLKARGLVTNGCECTGATGKTICGCKGASHLESLWAFSMDQVTLAGTSLAPGEAFRNSALRDDMLLVAISDVDLNDESPGIATGDQTPLRLRAGDVAWIPSGRHKLRNAGTNLAHFATLEF
jgi:hypothetical protein